MPWRAGVPAVPVRDVVVHPRDLDLVVGTHGRGVLIVDDVRPLQELALHGTPSGLTVFAPSPAIAAGTHEAIGYRSTGHAMQFGTMRPYGALLTFWFDGENAPYTVEIEDAQGTRVAELSGRARAGMNRVVWNLRLEFEDAPGARPTALPGLYTVRVQVEEQRAQADLEVLPDPRRPHDADARVAKLAAVRLAGQRLAATMEARSGIRALQRDLIACSWGSLMAEAGNSTMM